MSYSNACYSNALVTKAIIKEKRGVLLGLKINKTTVNIAHMLQRSTVCIYRTHNASSTSVNIKCIGICRKKGNICVSLKESRKRSNFVLYLSLKANENRLNGEI